MCRTEHQEGQPHDRLPDHSPGHSPEHPPKSRAKGLVFSFQPPKI
jgi:hypothetical protein